jgi:hypothetical protein
MRISIKEAGTYYAYISIEEGPTIIDLGLCNRRELLEFRNHLAETVGELDNTIQRIREREETHKRLEEQK